MSPRIFKAATRGSLLAVTQTGQSLNYLREKSGMQCETLEISTKGDTVQDKPLSSFGGVGVFVKELERALMDGRADLAVHSLKDVPTEQPEGLVLAAYLPRQDVRDIILSADGLGLDSLGRGKTAGTGSPRRRVQLSNLRPGTKFAELRGNIDTRMKRLEEGHFDALVLAAAGLRRLGKNIPQSALIDPLVLIPAPGQGAIAVECRADDREVLDALSQADDSDTRDAVTAERAFLNELEGGCSIPVGAYATVKGERLVLHVLAGEPKSFRQIRMTDEFSRKDAEEGGRRMSDTLRKRAKEEGLELPY